MFRAPDGSQFRGTGIVDRLNRGLDDGVAGIYHETPVVAAGSEIGEDVHLARICIDKGPPELRAEGSGNGIAFIVILIHKGGYANYIVPIKNVGFASIFLPVLVKDEINQLVDIH